MKVSFTIKGAVGILISLLLLGLVIRNTRFDLFWANYRHLKMEWFALGLLIHIAQTFLLGWRWSMLFEIPSVRQPYAFVASYWLGNFFNNLLPGRIGDLIKVRFITIEYGISYQNGIAALIAEKFLDVQAMGLIVMLMSYFSPINLPLINWVAAGVAVAVLASDVFVLLFVIKKSLLKKILGWLPSAEARAWLYGLFLLFKSKLHNLMRSKSMGLFLTGSTGIYLVGVLCYYLLMTAAGLQDHFTDFSTCMAFPIFFLVIHFVPSAPSGVGVVHYGIYKALLTIAVAKGITITPALENQIIFSTLLFHFLYFIPETLIGFFYMVQERRGLFAVTNGRHS